VPFSPDALQVLPGAVFQHGMYAELVIVEAEIVFRLSVKAEEECMEAFKGRAFAGLIEAIDDVQAAGIGEIERLLLKRTIATECHAEEPHGSSSLGPALSSTVANSKMSS